MKSIGLSAVVCSFLVVLAVSAYGKELGNGQPGCKTEEELQVNLYRNLWDPTAFWKCENLNEAAILGRCPDQQAFQDKLKKCVPWDNWEWENPHSPPSTP